jgi:RHS repeat-associated protein
MKKIITLFSVIVMLLALSIPAQAIARELPVTGITGGSNTAIMAPVQYLIDNDISTIWQSNGAATGPLWVQLQLGQAAFIEGLQIYGPYTGSLNIEYWQDGGWHSLLAVRDLTGSSSGWNLIDLSYDRIVTDRIRLTLTAAQSQILGGIGEVKILGRLPENLFERIDPVSVSGSSQSEYEHPASFLFDRNTYSTWWVYSGSPEADAVADLGVACTVKRIKVCGSGPETKQRQNQGTLRVQYLVNGLWADLPGFPRLDLKTMPNGWETLDLPNPVTTTKIRVVLLGYSRLGGIREMEIWGSRTDFTGGKYFYASGNPVAITQTQDANFQYNFTQAPAGDLILHVAGTGSQAILLWELNGRPMGNLTPVAENYGTFLYQAPVSAGWLQDGPNFIRISGSGTTITSCRMEVVNSDDNLTGNITGFTGNITGFTANITGLNDRLVFTPVPGGENIIDLGGTIHIDELVLRYLNPAPIFTLAVERDGQWIPLEITPVNQPGLFGGELVFSGIGLAQKIKLDCQGACELVINGSCLLDGAPRVKLLHPLDGTIYTLSQWGTDSLTGTVDNPDVELKINGQKIHFTGTRFTIPLPQTGNPDGNKVIEAVVADAQGRTGTDKIVISISNPPDFTLNLPERIIYTQDAQISLSGQVIIPQSRVTVNGVSVPLQNLKFSTVVLLKEGLNQITVKVAPNNNTVNTLTRWVVRNSSGPYLKVSYPVDGQITKDNTITVSGEVSSLTPVQVTVNGKPAGAASGFFTSAAIPLTEGNNSLTVIATDATGVATKTTLTVKRDGTPPALTHIVPADGVYLNTATVTVSGNVSDASPVAVLVNGKAASVTNGQFSISLILNEGQNSLKITAYDAAGNQSSVTSGVYLDTIAPAEFTPSGNPSGWTNNNMPEITFYTIDGESGIGHYELKLDDGTWSSPVTSPYQFAVAIADGEHMVTVKAVDKAGNQRVGEVKVYIDTTPPNVPQFLRVIPGNGRMMIKWSEDSTDVVEYRLERDPAFTTVTTPMVSVAEKEYIDPELANGTIYKYQVWAIDHAGNQSGVTEWKEGTVGVATAPYVPEQGTIIEYDHVTLAIPKTGLPDGIAGIEITEVTSEYLQEKAIYPQVGPIYEFSAIKASDGTSYENLALEQGYIGKIQYDPAQVPQGFAEQNLGVYHYDPMFDRWFQIPSAGVDIQNHTIYFVTNHFSSFSVQATIIQDLSPQEYKDAGYSPLRSYSEHGGVSISPQGGTASTSVTELVLPGRNGFDFVLKRRYDSATARADAFGLEVNGKIGFNLFNSDTKSLVTLADIKKEYEEWKKGYNFINETLRSIIESYLFNQGDFAYSMGQGWRLNIPYIKAANGSMMICTADGAMYSINEMQIVDVPISLPSLRLVTFRQTEGDEFTLSIRQIKDSFTKLLTGKDQIFKTKWLSMGYTLTMKDGTIYEMDGLGRTISITDPPGKNVIRFHYTALFLDYIEDSMGRKVRFGYNMTLLWPRINQIWVENDQPYNRHISYDVHADALLYGATDTGGRTSGYQYDTRILFGGSAGFTINILEMLLKYVIGGPLAGLASSIFGINDFEICANLQAQVVFPLNEARAPGQGLVRIGYDQPTLIYGNTTINYFWIIPASVTFSINLQQRLLANSVEVYTNSGDLIRRSNFSYDIGYHSYGQPFISKTVENNGKCKTVNFYTAVEKLRYRWEDRYFAGGINDPLSVWFPVVYHSTSILPINTSTQVLDTQDSLLETTTVTYNTDTMRPTQQTVWHGGNYRKLTYKYDGRNNLIYQEDYSVTSDRTNQTKTWMYYLPDTSCSESGATWLNKPFTQVALDKDRHNLLAGKVVANFVYSRNGVSHVTYLHTYFQYNALGEQITVAQWNGTEWLTSNFEYHKTFGSITKKTNPAGHETVYEYDSNGFLSAVTEKAVQDAKGDTVDLTTRFRYEFISGWKLWQQDPRGYVTQYQYDVLGRTTGITAPDDDDQAGWIPSGSTPSFRTNNPVTAITYNDQNLYSIVTDPLGHQTKYDFDDLGKLVQLVKYHQENGQEKPVITTLEYDGWGNITAITDPNQHITKYQYDAMGRNIAIKYPDDQGRTPSKRMDFDYTSNVLTITDENGKQAYEYQDMLGRIYKREQVYNYQSLITEYYFDGLGNEVISIDPKGSVTTKTYNLLNQLVRVDLPTEKFRENGSEVTVAPYQRFTYDKAGFKIAEIHPLAGTGSEITNRIEVNALGRTIRTITPYSVSGDSKEAVNEIYYDGNGNKVKVIDANNTVLPREQQKAAIYEYSAANLLVAEIDPAGNKTTYTYDKAGNRTGMTDPRGNCGKYDVDFTIVYQYDDLNRLVMGYLPAASGQTSKPVVRLTYDARGNLLQRVEPDGGKTSYTYTARNKVKTGTVTGNGVSYTTEHVYDLVGNEIETIDPKSNKIVKEYDDLNRVKTITYPEQNGKVVERFRYDENGNKVQYINGRSVATNYKYDCYNHLLEVTDANKGVASYHYDRWGNMTRMVNALGHTTNYEYDELNRLLKETDPQLHVKQYGYDAVGNRLWSQDANGTMSRYDYTLNNLVSQVTLQNGEAVQKINYLYDEAGLRKWIKYGNVITEYNTDANVYIPDPFGRIHKETKLFDGKSFTVGYDYDVMGRVTKITYPTGQTVDYEYNSLGQLQKVPGWVDEAPVYDQGGMLKSLKAANGITAGYDYDQNGRLVGLNYANQATALKSYSLKYDETNNIIKKNNDAFQYDLLNQLLYANLKGNFAIDQEEETQKIGKTRSDFKGQKTFEFELSQMDVIELDYAAGSIGVDLLAPVKVTKIELQPNSPIHRVTKSTSIRVYISQDNITYTRFKDWKMVAKEKGKVEIVLNTAVTARYIKMKSMFDERDNLLNPVNQAQFVNVPQDLIHVYYLMNMRQEEYSYDKIGNRLTETVTQRYPVARNYMYYSNSSRLKSNGKWNFEYDANGNLVKKETLIGEKITWKYEYDLFNRLVKVTKNDGVVAEYLYDEAGLRIKKQGTNSAIYYTFDTGGNVLFEQENREYMEYIYVLGKHFARVDGNLDGGTTKKYFYHTDHLGSTVLVTDETGKQVWNAEYTPFGKQVSKEGEMDHVTQFTGKDLDEDTGLYYFNARWYDQEVGRFISEDTITDPCNPMTLNLYTYCSNNPLIYVDPTGHVAWESYKSTENKDSDNYMGSPKINNNDDASKINDLSKKIDEAVKDGSPDAVKNAVDEAKQTVGQTSTDQKKEEWKFTSDPLESMEIRGKSKSNTFGKDVRKYDNGNPKPHQGVDLKASVGTEVKSVEDAEVVRVVKNPSDKEGYGNYVVIKFEKDGKTYYAMYGHLSEIGKDSTGKELTAGAKVTASQVLGKSGNSGNAYNMSKENEHLHFELNTSDSWGKGIGTRVDPLPHFNAQMEVK